MALGGSRGSGGVLGVSGDPKGFRGGSCVVQGRGVLEGSLGVLGGSLGGVTGGFGVPGWVPFAPPLGAAAAARAEPDEPPMTQEVPPPTGSSPTPHPSSPPPSILHPHPRD